MSARILILDPLSLSGKAFLESGDRLDRMAGEFTFLHSALDDEHQIAEVAGSPALVPHVQDAEDFAGSDVIVVASDDISSRHDHLLEYLGNNPDVALVDLTRLGCFDNLVEPSTGRTTTESRRLRVAHPALAAASPVLEILGHLARVRGTLATIDPVSSLGMESVELLVQQARLRIQGATVEDRIHGHILAFNVVAIDASDLQSEAAAVLPDVPLAVSRSLGGSFHGHVVTLGLSFDRAVEDHEIQGALGESDELELCDFPTALDSVPDRRRILVAPPTLSPDGTQLSMILMADGLRLSAVTTAHDILDTLI